MVSEDRASSYRVPKDEEEFEQSVVNMRKQLEEAIFDEEHSMKPEMFLSTEMLAYRLTDEWYKTICAFEDLHSIINETLYEAVCRVCDANCDPENKAYYQVEMMNAMLPESINGAQWSAYCVFTAAVAFAFAAGSVDASLSESEREACKHSLEMYRSDIETNTPYNKSDALSLLCDLMGILDESQSFLSNLKPMLLKMLKTQGADKAFLAFLKEEKAA